MIYRIANRFENTFQTNYKLYLYQETCVLFYYDNAERYFTVFYDVVSWKVLPERSKLLKTKRRLSTLKQKIT